MEKNIYLELARKNGWDKKIPRFKDGTYDCDIFGGDNVNFDFDIRISGNFSLGNQVHLCNIFAGDDVAIGDNAETLNIFADGDVNIGDNARTLGISAGRDLTIGYNASTTCDIFARGNITRCY